MTATATDHDGLEALSFDDCLSLLAGAPIGRVAFHEDGEILVLPVYYAVDGQDVVFLTAGGTLLDLADRGAPLSFEADSYDESAERGWSVLVTGVAEPVDDPAAAARLDRLGLQAWTAPLREATWVRIRPTTVTGRRTPRIEG